MGIVLDFRKRRREERKDRDRQVPAGQIIIFPGVRYERTEQRQVPWGPVEWLAGQTLKPSSQS